VLRPLQERFKPEMFPNLLVGLAISDDAAVYRVTDDIALIQTVDFFPPVVDDPYDYGAISAANALSDIYAMGGEVALALNIAGFPPTLPPEVVSEIIRGGADKVAEAGGVIAGGHTIDCDEPIYGLSVTGFIHPDRAATKGAVQLGDTLYVTKRLGVGMITTALKGEVADPAHVAAAVESMKKLNRAAAELAYQAELVAITDVTGFGLLGHGYEMAEKSGVAIRFDVAKLPFHDGALQYAEDWLFPAGSCHNEDAYRRHVRFGADVSEEMQMLLFTPESSGGLLLAAGEGKRQRLVDLFAEAGEPLWEIGSAEEGRGLIVM
jgi:selenide, water dikinase